MRPQTRYFEMMDDVHIPGRWYVDSPLEDDPEKGFKYIPYHFCRGEILRWEDPIFLPLFRPGLALDFSEAGIGFVVVSGRFVSLCERLGIQNEVQFIPAQVEGHPEPYFLLNTLRIIRCVDEARCEEFSFWESRHGDLERVGHYRNLSGLKLDPEKIGDASIFRPWGWSTALIVSERVKLAIEEEGLRRPKFIEV